MSFEGLLGFVELEILFVSTLLYGHYLLYLHSNEFVCMSL